MKNIISDNDGVAYLLLVGLGFTIVITGITFSFTSDFVDYVLGSINSYQGTPLAGQLDQDSIQTGNLLLLLFKIVLLPSLFCLMYFIWSMSQKPVRSW